MSAMGRKLTLNSDRAIRLTDRHHTDPVIAKTPRHGAYLLRSIRAAKREWQS